jgi:hypothetical protein
MNFEFEKIEGELRQGKEKEKKIRVGVVIFSGNCL